ncbi:MAG: DUF4398 domain-containing protein [Bacteroidota bacterium]
MPHLRALLVSAFAVALVGCGSSRPPVAPVQPVITSAERSVAEAEQAGASTHAPAELRTARQKIDQAEQMLRSGDERVALRLAEQAEVDAELAEATSRSAVAQVAIDEIRETIRVLREEIERNRAR